MTITVVTVDPRTGEMESPDRGRRIFTPLRDDGSAVPLHTQAMRKFTNILTFLLLIAVAAAQSPERPKAEANLKEVVEMALSSSHLMKRARALQKEQEWGIERALAPTRPQIRVVGSTNYSTPIPSISLGGNTIALNEEWNYSVTASLEQTISDFGRSHWRLKAASFGEKAADWEREETRRLITLTVSRLFFETLTAESLTKIAHDNLLARQEMLRVSKVRVEKGVAAEYELFRSRSELAQAEAEVLRSETAHQQRLKRLQSLTSKSVVPRRPHFSPLPPESFEGAREQALSRPDLERLRHLLAQQESLTEYEGSQNSPRLAFFSEYTRQNPVGLQLDHRWMTGLRLEIPIFDGGLTKAKKKQSRSREAQIQANLDEQLRKVFLQIEDVYLDFKLKADELEPFRLQVEQAQEAHRLSKLRYEIGLSSLLELLETRAALTRAQQNLKKSELSLHLAWVEWKATTGSLSEGIAHLTERNKTYE